MITRETVYSIRILQLCTVDWYPVVATLRIAAAVRDPVLCSLPLLIQQQQPKTASWDSEWTSLSNTWEKEFWMQGMSVKNGQDVLV